MSRMQCVAVAFAVALAVLAGAPAEALATKAIANWNFVPFQTLTAPVKVGVVAFHETGVDVVFSINGKEAARVAEPTWNNQTRVHEYWIEVKPADYADGPIVLTATALPDGEGHAPRALAELPLYANSKGTLPQGKAVWADAAAGNDQNGDGSEQLPFATIAKAVQAAGDGGTVYLKAGKDYKLTPIGGGANAKYWTTVAAAPGLKADDVHILTYGPDDSSTGRYGRTGIRWKTVSLYCDRAPGWGTIFAFGNNERAWFDDVVLFDKKGRFGNTTLFNRGRTFVTNSLVRDVANVQGAFHQNVRMERIASDIFRGTTGLFAVNVSIHTVDRGDTSAHPDFLQFYNPTQPVENVILYNIRALDMQAQGIFGAQGDVTDVAIVNVLLEKQPANSALVSQVSGNWQHTLLWHVTLVNQPFNFRDPSKMKHWDVRNCVFDAFTGAGGTKLPEESTATAVHASRLSWQQKEGLGERATVGDVQFVDKAGKDFRLKPGSPAVGSGVSVPGVPGDIDGHLFDPAKRDRGAFSARNDGKPYAP